MSDTPFNWKQPAGKALEAALNRALALDADTQAALRGLDGQRVALTLTSPPLAMQVRVEKLHRAWTKDREYLAPPTVGTLAELDPAQMVQPPKGFEIGYVPIATRQELAKGPGASR